MNAEKYYVWQLITGNHSQIVTVCPESTRDEIIMRNPYINDAVPIIRKLNRPTGPLSVAEDRKIRKWLEFIGETSPDVIREVFDLCDSDAESRAGFLRNAS